MRSLAIALLLLAACRRDSRYLGDTRPPRGEMLVYVNTNEPATLDPALQNSSTDGNIQQCLFEGLTTNNPVTSQPLAGMATNYEVSPDGMQYTFYLRGHPNPKGTRLPGIDSLPPEFSHGVRPPPDAAPARWSDGSSVTASDFVYSWRRIVDPRTASPNTADLSVILNAQQIAAGRLAPKQLGVEALDDFTLRVLLVTTAPYFLTLVAQPDFMPVPQHIVERRREQWSRRGNLIGNGPFVLAEWRPYDCLKVRKSPTYYERDMVKLEEVSFLPTGGPPVINLYRAGLVQTMWPDSLPPSLIPALESNRDFRADRLFALMFLSIDLHEPPFDNQMLRWAVNMAIDKRAAAGLLHADPAHQIVPATPGYSPGDSVIVTVRGKNHNILAYDPAGAREILAEAGYPGGVSTSGARLSFPINAWSERADICEMIRYQLRANLNIEPRVNPMEFNVMAAAQTAGSNSGFTVFAWNFGYADPYALLGPMFTDWAGWHDSGYADQLDMANRTVGLPDRLRKLAECERSFMRAMPVIPLTFIVNNYLSKPYLRGMKMDLFGEVFFRYASIDHTFRGGE